MHTLMMPSPDWPLSELAFLYYICMASIHILSESCELQETCNTDLVSH